MKGLDWLRAKTRQQRKPALQWEPDNTRQTTLVVDNRSGAYTPPADLQRVAPLVVAAMEEREVEAPIGISLREPTRAEIERTRQRFETAIGPTALRCPCGVIYSRCYYGH